MSAVTITTTSAWLPTFSDGFISGSLIHRQTDFISACAPPLGSLPHHRYTHTMLGLVTLLSIALVLLIALLSAMLAREMVRPPRHAVAYAIAHNMACDPGDLNLPFQSWQL